MLTLSSTLHLYSRDSVKRIWMLVSVSEREILFVEAYHKLRKQSLKSEGVSPISTLMHPEEEPSWGYQAKEK